MLCGCEQSQSDHPVFIYYPPNDVFEDGYVSKYYHHYYPDNPDASAGTEIRYVKYLKLDNQHFKTENYDAALELESERYYSVEQSTVSMDRGMGVNHLLDTIEMNLVSKIQSNWEGKTTEPYQVQYEWNEKDYLYTEYQRSVSDTTILGRQAKVFVNEWYRQELGSDSTFSEGITRSYYVKGLGFYGSDSKGENYRRQMELIEQMSLKEFEKRANHGEHRVAWIDPKQTISDDSDFTICNHERRIMDYYNSTPDGRYLHGKRAMMDTIYSNLDKSKLFDQEGMLTFRFVVNCEGKAGRFIAKGYGVSYQPMTFRSETIDHLYGILQKLNEWRPVVLQEESRDAYFYITFKISNGEIINILP